MTTYTRPLVNGTPTTGQVVKAAHVNEPIDQIYDTILAGGITSDQIAAGAVDTSELATAAVTAAKMDGTLPDASAMATSAAPTTDAQLANKKYVDDNVGSANYSPTSQTGADDSNGEITLPNGLEMKWGKKTMGANTGTFDYTDEGLSDFSNACFQVIICGGDTDQSSQTVQCHSPTTTSFQWSSSAFANNNPFRFIAIGR